MNVRELNREQLLQLKQRYLCETQDECVSYGELAAADELVTDEQVFKMFDGYDFVEEDFFE